MALIRTEETCFSFIWKIENITFRSERICGKSMTSPRFVVDEIDKTRWTLSLYPNGQKDSSGGISIYLGREYDASTAATPEVEFDFSLIGKDGSVLYEHPTLENSFEKLDAWGTNCFIKQEEVFYAKKSLFLPEDTLTVRCRIWKANESMLQDVQCFARTRIAVEHASFLWNIENFSNLQSDKRCSYVFKSHETDKPLMSVDLFVTEGKNVDEIIPLKLSRQDESIGHSCLLLSLIDASGFRAVREAYEFGFDNQRKSTPFMFHLTRQMLLEDKNLYLPNDVLSLRWEWAFSKGTLLNEIEKVQYADPTSEDKIPVAPEVDNGIPSNSLVADIKSFYDEKLICDVNLKTVTSLFPVHKDILSASSPVFKTLFSNIREGNDCVDIENLNDGTVREMLRYIYTSRVEDLTWKSVTELYAAANKYAIPGLKTTCSSYMMESLSTSNACEALQLAENHADDQFKVTLMDYIEKHGKQIVKSEWRLLINSNAKLAAEALYHLLIED